MNQKQKNIYSPAAASMQKKQQKNKGKKSINATGIGVKKCN